MTFLEAMREWVASISLAGFVLLGGCARTDPALWNDDILGASGAPTGSVASTVGGSDSAGAVTSTVGAGGGVGIGTGADGGAGTSTGTGGGAGIGGSTEGRDTDAVATTGTTDGTLPESDPEEPEPEPEPEPEGCYCAENQICDLETQTCRCAEGYVALPSSAELCVPDPCAGVDCGGKGTCSIAENGRARCDCAGEGTGLECNQRWYSIDVPPFAEDIVFDGDGNGWFSTTEGVLYWDFNDTPENTADDSWHLFREFDGYDQEVRGVVIDSRGVKWVLAGSRLHRIDDNGTPENTADDTWENYELTYWRNSGTRRIVLDGDDRLWWVGQAGTGVKVLPAGELQADPPEVSDPKWVALFTTEVVHDVAVVGDGVWIGAESGLYYVSLGETLSDETDDVWTAMCGSKTSRLRARRTARGI